MLACIALVAVSIFFAIDPPMRPIIREPFSFAYDIVRTTHVFGDTTSIVADYRTHDDVYVLIDRVHHNGVDVTDRFDHNALVELLASTMSQRAGVFGAYYVDDVLWEINLHHRGPIHILLSRPDAVQELNYWYVSGDMPGYRILEPQAFSDALSQMMGDSGASPE